MKKIQIYFSSIYIKNISQVEYLYLLIDKKTNLQYIFVDNILCSFACWVNVFVWSRRNHAVLA